MKIFAGYIFPAILDVHNIVKDGWPKLWPEGARGPAFKQKMPIKFRLAATQGLSVPQQRDDSKRES